ncbi:MAG: hypothetical protein HEQ29_01030 [Dolichospermum sp. LBC05a]|nr:hypothetical protein [Dolichospermum sp. OL01]MCO5795440.1 hypothetical protein [Dolichospermum sp. OL03]MCS6282454.1 hypothetical protein [Dolichospermum sp.]QSV57151.1 MAG: hypothetical protein HEQ29_01030 [Dolichospermum sp. LBC05a]
MSFVICQWSVGAKHLEDKLSVIAKNSSPNASPVQWSVVKEKQRTTDNEQLTTNN